MTRYALFLFAALVASPVLAAAPVSSAARQTMVYDVYARGIRVLDATLVIDTSEKGRYDILLDSQTKGFLGLLVPWKGTFESKGWALKGGKFVPELHRSEDSWRGQSEIKEYHYDQKKGFQYLMETRKGKARKAPAHEDLTKGTTDALSVALEVLQKVANGGKCEGAADVFDGRRRYKESFSETGTDKLEPTGNNKFAGEAARCEVKIEPVAGEWFQKPRGWMSIQEQGRQSGALPTMWAGNLTKGVPAVPVKIQIKTQYGTIIMQLADYKESAKMPDKKAQEK